MMVECANPNCDKDALNSRHSVIVNMDGDIACCKECREEYKKEMKIFIQRLHSGLDLIEWIENG